jgi:Nucleotide-diphospho-sugar transferase
MESQSIPFPWHASRTFFTMQRRLARNDYTAQLVRFAAISILVWHNFSLLQKTLPKFDFSDIQLDGFQKGFAFSSARRRVRFYDAESILDPADIAIIDIVDPKEWPPMEMLEVIIAKSAVSDVGKNPDAPRLVVAASSSEDLVFADNFANSLLSNKVTNFVLVPLDSKAYEILKKIYPKHTLPVLPGLESRNASSDALKLSEYEVYTAHRPIIISYFLKQGYAVFYNDVDNVWQHNAWEEIETLFNSTAIMKSSEDKPQSLSSPESFFWNDEPHELCNCMMFLLPTFSSISIMKEWEKMVRLKRADNDQIALTALVERLTKPFVWESFTSIRIIPNNVQFPSGKSFSWGVAIPENKAAVIVHNSLFTSKAQQRKRFEKSALWNPSEQMKQMNVEFSSWPSMKLIDTLLAKAVIPSTTETTNGIPRVIVAASNLEFVDFADNFANSLLSLNITNFVFVPLDTKAYDVLHAAYPEHTLPTMPGVEDHLEERANFGSAVFKTLTSSRPVFLQSFLRHGYAVLYNDIDTVWQHNAWDFIDEQNMENEFDKIMWQDTDYQICTCMLYLEPTADSILLLEEWEDEINSESHQNNAYAFDQDAFANVAEKRKYSKLGGIFDTTKIIVNDAQFPAGKQYSWNQKIPENKKAIIVHNNWIVGKRPKLNRFHTAGLWNPSGLIESADDWPPSKLIDSLLKKAAEPSSIRTKEGFPRIIVAASNIEFVDFADNFANSLLALGVTNFVFVPLDAKAYEVLHSSYPEHTLPMMPLLESSLERLAMYGTREFKLLTATRPIVLRPFLEKGYAIFYNDIDMVWQQNAWDVVDKRDAQEKGNDAPFFESMLWKNGEYQICTCMMYFKPTADSIAMVKEWETEMDINTYYNHDQDAFAKIAFNRDLPHFGGVKNKTAVFVNDVEFPSGQEFSWNEVTPTNKAAVVVHNNYIVDIDEKRRRFATVGLWKPSGRLPK